MKRVLASLLGLVVALLVCELAVRALDLGPERYGLPRWEVWRDGAFQAAEKQEVGWIKRHSRFLDQGVAMGEYVPGARFRVVYDTDPRGYFGPQHAVEMRIDALGLRGPEVSAAKPPGTFRILGLGDSFTFGDGVRDEDTYLRRLETSLDAARPGGMRYEVLNAGTQGYNTRDEVLYLEHRWLELDPDLVLIGFYLNDAYSDATFMNRGEALGIYLQPEGIARYSALADLVLHAIHVRQVRREVHAFYREQFFSDGAAFLERPVGMQVDWTVSREALGHAAELARGRGFGLALVIFPELYALGDDYPFEDVHALVSSACEELGIPVLDLLDVFRGRDERTLWVHPSDHHLNEVGNREAAVAIEGFLRSEGMLPTL